MKKVLVAEDEESIREFIVINLTRSGYTVEQAENGAVALEKFAKDESGFDVAILDIMMPEVDGLAVCKQLRAKSSDLGIIMLSAKTQEMDKITGLMFGADDYVTKPFNPLELTARVKSQIRRYVRLGSLEVRESQLVTGGLVLDTDTKEVTVDGDPVRLTAREYKILEYLMHNIGRVLSSAQIYEAVWNEPAYGTEKTVTVHIRNIREKIEINPKEPKYLKVVYGFGYKVEKC